MPEDAELSSETKEQIKQHIKDHGHSVSDLDAFFDELDKALSHYKGFARFRREGLPATVRKNLKKAAKISMDLNAHIKNLDANSRQLLNEASAGSFRTHISGVVLALREALRRAEEYPKGGRLPEHHRIFLAADVADAIKQFIHVLPVSTRDGLYISILESVCTEAFEKFGKEVPDVYGLAQKALSYQVKITSADGVVEYCPPPNDD